MSGGPLWLGLDIGATKILALSIDADNRIRASVRMETGRDGGPREVLARCLEAGAELVAGQGPHVAAGAGFAGLVAADEGRVMSSIMLPGWDSFPLAAELAAGLDLPVVVDNDATMAGWGDYELLGRPPGLDLLALTVGTGIGGAIILDGRLHRGSRGVAAEFGNTTIDWQGERCWCGNRGCLNMLASGTAIMTGARELARQEGEELPPDTGVARLAELAAQGREWAAAAIARGAAALGAGLANLVNIFNPHLISLSGGVTGLGESYLEQVRRELAQRSFAEAMEGVELRISPLGDRVGAFGAACMAREKHRG